MRVFVTGVKGQLGHDVMNELAKRGHEGIGVDIEEMDITDAESVRKVITEANPDVVIHCAAWTAVDLAEDDDKKEKVHQVNAVGTENIAKVCHDLDCKMIYISTDYVFDGTNHRPYRESDKVNPISQYGTTKRKGETLLLALAPQAIIIRTAWLYSAHGKNFVKTMLRLADSQPEIKVVCDQIGTPTFARDLARAVVKVLQSHQWVPGIYHFTDEGAASWYDFAKAIFRIAGKDVKVTPIPTEDYPTPASRPSYSILDRTRIKATYGIEIPHWEEALADCLRQLGY